MEEKCTTGIDERGNVDLFESYELMPRDLATIVDHHTAMVDDDQYQVCRQMLAEVESIGYTFDFGLDGTPINLRLFS